MNPLTSIIEHIKFLIDAHCNELSIWSITTSEGIVINYISKTRAIQLKNFYGGKIKIIKLNYEKTTLNT